MSKKSSRKHRPSKRTQELLARADKHRENMTRAERAFAWQLQVAGVRFEPQRLFEPWIVDFYLPDHRLVVEVDGPSHLSFEAHKYDSSRTRHLLQRRKQIARVARVTNAQVVAGVKVEDVLAGKYDQKPSSKVSPHKAERWRKDAEHHQAMLAEQARVQALLDARPSVIRRRPLTPA